MAVRKRATQVETTLPKVVELAENNKKNQRESIDEAARHNGRLVNSPERLNQLLNDPEFIKTLENTEFCKKNGYVWFWTEVPGTEKDGWYRRNPKETDPEKMFTFVSSEWNSAVRNIPFEERSYFGKGNRPLSVVLGRSVVDGGRLFVDGIGRLVIAAPVVVVEQAQASSQAQAAIGSFYKIGKEGVLEPVKVTAAEAEQLVNTQGLRFLTLDEAVKMAASGVVVPTGAFDAGKAASVKAEALLRAADRHDLADALRAVFGE